ncbi:SAM-dependent chlorinase/fluorinase [Thermosynechococcus sp. HY213]|uniref:SAM hydrolase/SAM-dependent halogenase family protein n=1 Tax=unclassified Thermosynechococcus TaxID=2622553 RepID=UPI0028573AA6|nr:MULTISPECIES: SAM-dependent chlorinase/fluorinase [unclassified Thermosynechococcus]MDR7922517.1 SAM-dependent chlorinase/fluorinase [Thermosynechococcus sp. HY213]WNC59479.1 SAM-dependent chlorinase/fluorinase [Thermosynechococcus sp. QS41]
MACCITLLTDFGHQDVYVGVMKGVILSLYPQAQVIDLCHEIPPQDCRTASFQLLQAVPYFPPQTVHVVVVDPGVGTRRRAIALDLGIGYCVGPDNGVFSQVCDRYPPQRVVELTQPQFWRTPNPSATFHGRDIFAPVAAHLAAGTDLARLGSAIEPDSLVRLPHLTYEITPQGIQGWIQAIDHFGNVITTLPAALLAKDYHHIQIQGQQIPLVHTYGDVPPQHLMALVGSHGFIELAINGGNAQSLLGCQNGDAVWLV